MYNIKQETTYFDQDDIGGRKLLKAYGYCSDYYNQRAREKARVAFFKCFVPYKKKYGRVELERILTVAVINNKARWDKCGPDLYIEADMDYFLELCKFEIGLTYDKKYVYLDKCKPWKHIFNYEIPDDNPKLLLKRVYKANCIPNWEQMNDERFVDMIISLLNERRTFSALNKNSIYRNSKYLEAVIMLAELFESESVVKELKKYYARVNKAKTDVIDTIKHRIYEYNKLLELDYMMNTYHRENYLRKSIDSYVKLYNMITLKKIYY